MYKYILPILTILLFCCATPIQTEEIPSPLPQNYSCQARPGDYDIEHVEVLEAAECNVDLLTKIGWAIGESTLFKLEENIPCNKRDMNGDGWLWTKQDRMDLVIEPTIQCGQVSMRLTFIRNPDVNPNFHLEK